MTTIELILLGESGVGKTTILKRFKNETFEEISEATVAVEFYSKTVIVEGKEINLFLWDPSGQERYHALVNSYYRNKDGVLLVYDVTSPASFYKLSKWLCELKEMNENAVVLIVGNKNDDPFKKSVSVSMVKKFARDEELEYMEISALTGENVDEAFDFLIRNILKTKKILSEKSESSEGHGIQKLQRNEIVLLSNSCIVGATKEINHPKKNQSSCC